MYLSHLLHGIEPLPANADCDVARLVLDSRQVQKNDLFIALLGTQTDGRQYIAQAIAQGAKAILFEADHSQPIVWQEQIPLVPIPHLRERLSSLAARFYDFPSQKLTMIGVTGTSGKTSCSYFIAQILQSLQGPCGLIGTLGSGLYDHLVETGLTTPDAITLQHTLHNFLHAGARTAAMEVSSHSIHQGRINDIAFDIGIFTNLSQDHLDYHGDMETYAAVKRQFLDRPKNLIMNADDPWAQKWLKELTGHPSLYVYSTQDLRKSLHFPCIFAENATLTAHGIKAFVHSPWGEGELSLPLMGHFNLSNALAVLTALNIHGIPFAKAMAALARIEGVPGRMQMLGGQGKPLVVVDYAHKPDALEKVLTALRTHIQGQLVCVFGCGGERDRGKRPLMAKIAEKWADHIIVTNDNPRHEKPEDIAKEIMAGFAHPKRVTVMLDRSKAIENSIKWVKSKGVIEKDCILIAGKGAERYQQIGDEKHPFDDVVEVMRYL